MYYVIPVASVEETVIISSKDFREINGHLAMEFREKLVPILPLKKFFYDIEMASNSSQTIRVLYHYQIRRPLRRHHRQRSDRRTGHRPSRP
jgi:chemotaxis protein histidine kinase CheA